MKNLLVFGAIFLSTVISNLSSARLTEDQINKAWLNAGYSDRMLISNVLNEETCYATLEDFKGCVQSLNIFKSALNRKYTEVYSKDTPITTKIDFVDEVSKISAGSWTPEQIAFASGQAINKFFEVAYDPHTYEIPTELFQEQQSGEDNKYIGIGISYANKDDKMIVQTVFEGSGAQKAGVKVGDEIIAIEGVPVKGTASVVEQLKGPEGSKVNVTVLRSEKKLNMSISRSQINIKNISSHVYQDQNHKTWGVIKQNTFIELSTCDDFKAEFQKLEKMNISGLIWDLRDNGGGNIDQAQCILSTMLPANNVVIKIQDIETFELLQARDAIVITEHSTLHINLPVVVLINAGSASASELSAGVLQDYNRAWVVGEKSFGKGTVQGLREVNQGLIIRAETIGRFHLPSGRSNQRVGILPNFEVLTESNAYPREADLFPNTAPAFTERGGIERNPSEKLKACVTKKKLSLQSDESEGVADPMILRATSVLACEKI